MQAVYTLVISRHDRSGKPAIMAKGFSKYKELYLSRNLVCLIALILVLFFPTNLVFDVANASPDFHEAGPGTVFQVDRIEVTQAIQDDENSVPLIQGKTAVVRVWLHHATYQGYSPYINRVYGSIWVKDMSTGLGLRLFSMNTISAPGAPNIDRLNRDSSLNFLLVGSGIISYEGPLQISFEPWVDFKTGGRNGIGYPCTGGCEAHTYTLEKSQPVRIELLNIPYKRDASPASPVRNVRDVDFTALYNWLWRAYPTPHPIEDKYSRGSLSTTFNYPPEPTWYGCREVGSRLAMKAILDSEYSGTGFFTRVRYYGLVSDAEYGGGWMRGCASIPTTRLVFSPGDAFPGNMIKDNWVWVASGPAGSNTVGWDNDGSYADWYGGHEIGHLYGRGHPPYADLKGACTRKDSLITGTDFTYPYPDGLISGPDTVHDFPDKKYVGFDWLRQQAYPGNVWTDMMTYRCWQWISDYTYRGILKTLNEEGDTPIPKAPSIPAFGATERGPGETLVVVGNIDLVTKNVTMEPFLKLPGAAPYDAQPPNGGSLTIDLYNELGESLASYPIEAFPYTDTPPGEHESALISALVPFVSGTTKITISDNGEQIFSRDVLPTSPRITELSPANGEVFERGAGNNNITVSWNVTSDSSSELGTNPLTFFVMYSPDAGKSWHTVASHITENEVKLNLDDLPGSEEALFGVIATDGVNTDIAVSKDIFTIPFKEPQTTILSPSSNTTYSTGEAVLLAGEAFSRQDGSLYNTTSLQWSSNIQGHLGSGPIIAPSDLVPGEHVISLTAKDSTGLVGISSISLRVNEAQPQDTVNEAQPQDTVNEAQPQDTVNEAQPQDTFLANPNLVDRIPQTIR